jgi:hypothetical protein
VQSVWRLDTRTENEEHKGIAQVILWQAITLSCPMTCEPLKLETASPFHAALVFLLFAIRVPDDGTMHIIFLCVCVRAVKHFFQSVQYEYMVHKYCYM